jgi:hypothetical protein
VLLDVLRKVSHLSRGTTQKKNVAYLDHRIRNQVPDAEVLLQEQPDFGGADVVLNHLVDDPDVVLILPQRLEGLVDVGARAFDDESPVAAQDRVQVLGRPQSRLAWFLLAACDNTQKPIRPTYSWT